MVQLIGDSSFWAWLFSFLLHAGDCANGIHCKSTFSPHYKRYSHSLLATTRSCGIFEKQDEENNSKHLRDELVRNYFYAVARTFCPSFLHCYTPSVYLPSFFILCPLSFSLSLSCPFFPIISPLFSSIHFTHPFLLPLHFLSSLSFVFSFFSLCFSFLHFCLTLFHSLLLPYLSWDHMQFYT